jgi:hypothetical protein
MEHFYDGQIKRYLNQFMRLLSNFTYKDSKGILRQIPVRYGDMNRQVAQIMNKNSENVIQQAPFIACYIKSMDLARDRIQDPTFVSKVHIRERAWDEQGEEYLNVQGANYTVERLMPTPFNLQFTADIWTTNTDQKLQILEQMLVLFNPSMEIQTSNNYIDWTSLSLVELSGMTFSSRQVPQGIEQDIDIATLNFQTPIWLTPPAKVKKLGVITKIIANVFAEGPGESDPDLFNSSGRTATSVSATTLGNYGILVMNNQIRLIPEGGNGDRLLNWYTILDKYPGKFTADLSQVRMNKPNGNEIVGRISLDPSDDTVMHANWDPETLPEDTDISSNGFTRGTVDAIIDPTTYNPRPEDILQPDGYGWPQTDARYLVLDEIRSDAVYGSVAWKNQDGSAFVAQANDIIQWTGTRWIVIFDSNASTDAINITNQRTGVQYNWDGEQWLKSYEGIYRAIDWRLVL